MIKKYKKILLIITLVFAFSTNKVNASCTESELNHFKEIESKFTMKYEYDTNNNQTIIKLYNPESYRYAYILMEKIEVSYKMLDKYNYIITGDINETYTIKVYGLIDECIEPLKTFVIKPPEKVSVLKEEYCKGIEDFVLCQSEYDKTITREEFASRVESYKKSLKKEDKDEVSKNNNPVKNTENQEEKINFVDKIINYIQDNLIKVIIVVVFIILLIITAIILIRNNIKSRRLE